MPHIRLEQHFLLLLVFTYFPFMGRKKSPPISPHPSNPSKIPETFIYNPSLFLIKKISQFFLLPPPSREKQTKQAQNCRRNSDLLPFVEAPAPPAADFLSRAAFAMPGRRDIWVKKCPNQTEMGKGESALGEGKLLVGLR